MSGPRGTQSAYRLQQPRMVPPDTRMEHPDSSSASHENSLWRLEQVSMSYMDGSITFGRLKSKKNSGRHPPRTPRPASGGGTSGALLGTFQAPTHACRAAPTRKNVPKASPLEGARSALRGPSRVPTPPTACYSLLQPDPAGGPKGRLHTRR